MRSGRDIRQDIEAQPGGRSQIEASGIVIAVEGSVVTLSGSVSSYEEKLRAETAAKRVLGVAAVANDIQVRTLPAGVDDPAIATAAVCALHASVPISANLIRVIVSDGILTLEGQLESESDRERAEESVRHLPGVRMINNQIRFEPRVQPLEIKRRIEEAFRRSAELDAEGILVKVEGRTVTLEGKVRTAKERLQAQQTAWSAPGWSGSRTISR